MVRGSSITSAFWDYFSDSVFACWPRRRGSSSRRDAEASAASNHEEPIPTSPAAADAAGRDSPSSEPFLEHTSQERPNDASGEAPPSLEEAKDDVGFV